MCSRYAMSRVLSEWFERAPVIRRAGGAHEGCCRGLVWSPEGVTLLVCGCTPDERLLRLASVRQIAGPCQTWPEDGAFIREC